MVIFAQTLAAVLACYGLWHLYRFGSRVHPMARTIIAGGFLARVVPGLMLFWISYLNLPIARPLQLGDGFWFFGIDGRGFIRSALKVLGEGPDAVVFIDKTTPAFFYVQVIALVITLFGPAASVALLLNSAAYLGAASIFARWGTAGGEMTTGGKIALLVMSITPTGILWATQPLKESLFVFCVVLFLYTLRGFSDFVQSEHWNGNTLRRTLLSVLVLSATLYAVASIRWYFGVMLWCAGALAILMMQAAFAGRFRLRPVLMTVTAALISSQVLVAGSGPYMPIHLQEIFNPSTSVYALLSARSSVRAELEKARRTQEAVRGRTTFGGSTPTPAATEAAQAPRPVRAQPGRGLQPRGASIRETRSLNQVPRLRPQITAADARAAKDRARQVQAESAVQAAKRAAERAAAAAAETRAAPRIAPPPRPLAPSPLIPPPVDEQLKSGEFRRSDSRAHKLLIGLIALAIPTSISSRLGLLELSGGRGLWIFAEIDTLIFDATFLVALFFAVRAARRRWANMPLFWPLVALVLMATVAIAYVSTNYGTLLRHRGMILLCLCLITLVVSSAERKKVEATSVAD